MKRLLLAGVATLLLGLPLAVGGLLWLGSDDAPALQRTAELAPRHVERALQILSRHDPRRRQGGGLRVIDLSAEEADLAANYLANQYANGSARVSLAAGKITVQLSVPSPAPLAGRFLNLHAVLRETEALPVVEALRLGRLPLPPSLLEYAFARAVQARQADAQVRTLASALRGVTVGEHRLRVRYEWQADLPDRLRRAALPPDDVARIRSYHARLAEFVGGADKPPALSLARLLVPLAQHATDRAGRAGGGDAEAESRALIAVLAFYVTAQPLGMIAPDAAAWPRAPRRQVTLGGRGDLAQHFAVSALLAAHAGSPLADAVGVYKELRDARGGSGFSFNDLAADRAGTVFGELAVAPGGAAAALHRRLAAGIVERDLMPDVADLPEFMPEAEFRRRFGGVDAPAYQAMLREIERRIAACALYRRGAAD